MTKKEENNRLHNVLFHYNPYKKMWFCIHREDVRNYFNGEATSNHVGKGKEVSDALMKYELKNNLVV